MKSDELKGVIWQVKTFLKFIFLVVPVLFFKDILKFFTTLGNELVRPVNLSMLCLVGGVVAGVKGAPWVSAFFGAAALFFAAEWVWKSGIHIHYERMRTAKRVKNLAEQQKKEVK